MLSRMKPSLAEIKRALLTIDDSVLSIDDLKAIARHVPTLDEVHLVKRAPKGNIYTDIHHRSGGSTSMAMRSDLQRRISTSKK